MSSYCLIVLAGLCSAGPVSAATWAEGTFDELSKDFGSVPRGPTLSHPFRVKNNTSGTLTISSVRVSCGCVSTAVLKTSLKPGEETAILARMDTARFSGIKNVTIFVQFSEPRWEEVRLWVQANSRDDVVIAPKQLAFGHAKRGKSSSAAVLVTFLGTGHSKIVDVETESNYIKPSLKEK